jgi:hypothetical protein
MSNLSNIGFPAQTGKDYGQLIALVATDGEKIPSEKGVYLKYTDPSGAELYCQINKKNEILGMNPHYNGKSKFPVSLTSKVERSESALDGAFHAWAAPVKKDDPESGAYPFVFDLPDFYTLPAFNFPHYTDIQLAAFAQNEFELFSSEEAFTESRKEGIKFGSKSFISIGLFSNKEDNVSPEAYALLNGIIIEWERKTNKNTGKDFYWLLTETLGGVIDVIADPSLIKKEPEKGWIVSGEFWLSGRIIR